MAFPAILNKLFNLLHSQDRFKIFYLEYTQQLFEEYGRVFKSKIMIELAKSCLLIAVRVCIVSVFFNLFTCDVNTIVQEWNQAFLQTDSCLFNPEPCSRKGLQLSEFVAIFVAIAHRVASLSALKLLLKACGIPIA